MANRSEYCPWCRFMQVVVARRMILRGPRRGQLHPVKYLAHERLVDGQWVRCPGSNKPVQGPAVSQETRGG